MVVDNSIIIVFVIILFIISYILIFTLGLFIGLFWSNRGVSTNTGLLNRSKHSNTTTNSNTKISIDDSKFVTDIKTEGMEKKYTTIGETKNSSENITESIAKLKNMKR